MLSIFYVTFVIPILFNLAICQMVSMPFSGQSFLPFPGPMPGFLPQPTPGFMPPPVKAPVLHQIMPPGMPLPMPMSQPKLPVVVMPFYSKRKTSPPPRRHKKRKPRKKYISDSSCSSDSDTDSSSSDIDFRAIKRSKHAKRKNRQHRVLTPFLSYVTKDGYVVYQKKIKKDKAKDWLQMDRRSDYADSKVIKRKDMSLNEMKKEIMGKFLKQSEYD